VPHLLLDTQLISLTFGTMTRSFSLSFSSNSESSLDFRFDFYFDFSAVATTGHLALKSLLSEF